MTATDLPININTSIPTFHSSIFIADGAKIIGDVKIGNNSSIWYNAVLRADINHIQIGDNTNIQDGSVLHVGNNHPCIIGNNCTIGHNVNLHGCVVENACLIGIGAIVLSGAIIGQGSVIGAGALIREGQIITPGSMVVGVPGKTIKNLEPHTIQTHIKWANKYQALAKKYTSSP